jgi:hypothetical protein
MPDDENGESEEERFNRFYETRRKAEQDAEDQAKKLKGLGLTADVLGAIGAAVADEFERRADAARKAADEADQAPTTEGRGAKPKAGLFGLFPATGTDE